MNNKPTMAKKVFLGCNVAPENKLQFNRPNTASVQLILIHNFIKYLSNIVPKLCRPKSCKRMPGGRGASHPSWLPRVIRALFITLLRLRELLLGIFSFLSMFVFMVTLYNCCLLYTSRCV